MRKALLCLIAFVLLAPSGHAQGVPVFTITPVQSTIKFYVKSSVDLTGIFDKWDATLTFTSPDVTTGGLDIKISAASVDTGSGMKDGTLKSDQSFDVKNHPDITFRSTKISQTGPATFEVAGNLTIRGVSKRQTLVLKATPDGSGGEVKGTMTFDRKDFGMNGGVPLVKIADSVAVIVNLKAKRLSGAPLRM